MAGPSEPAVLAGLRVWVTGAGGMLGRDVVAAFRRRGAAVRPLTRAELDITQGAAVREALAGRGAEEAGGPPDVVVNCAAYTDVDGAESPAGRAAAFAANGLGVRHLAWACREAGALLVHFSTDYVFDGEREGAWGVYDPPAPPNAYGESKLWGERALAEAGCRHLLVRTSWLCGPGGRNFVETMIALGERWREGAPPGDAPPAPLRVVDDRRGCPTFTADLAAAAADLVAAGARGTFHVTNRGATTWYGFARAVFARLGWDVPVEPVASAAFPRPARRPRNSVLDPFPLEEAIGRLLPPWEESLTAYLRARAGGRPR